MSASTARILDVRSMEDPGRRDVAREHTTFCARLCSCSLQSPAVFFPFPGSIFRTRCCGAAWSPGSTASFSERRRLASGVPLLSAGFSEGALGSGHRVPGWVRRARHAHPLRRRANVHFGSREKTAQRMNGLRRSTVDERNHHDRTVVASINEGVMSEGNVFFRVRVPGALSLSHMAIYPCSAFEISYRARTRKGPPWQRRATTFHGPGCRCQDNQTTRCISINEGQQLAIRQRERPRQHKSNK